MAPAPRVRLLNSQLLHKALTFPTHWAIKITDNRKFYQLVYRMLPKQLLLLVVLGVSFLVAPATFSAPSLPGGSSGGGAGVGTGIGAGGAGKGKGGAGGGAGGANKNDSVEGMQERRYSYLMSAEGAGARASTQPSYGFGGTDIRDEKGSAMPGMIMGANLNGMLYSEVPMLPLATVMFPVASRAQEQEMYAHCPPLTGYHLTDSADYINTSIANDILLGKVSDPERWIGVSKATQQAQNTQMGNALAELTRTQANSAIDFCSNYLTNFTTATQWINVRDRLFIPIALLLLLPGAMLAQVKAIVAAGNPVVEQTEPFEGILRSIIAIFLIPATCLVLNYGIDVSNSLTLTIQNEYKAIFNDDMYKSAICAEVRAFPVRQESENRGTYDVPTAKMGQLLPQSKTVFAKVEGQLFSTKIEDPCVPLYIAPADRVDEALPISVVAARLAFNGMNAALTCAWNGLCAFQTVYLYYLWFMGPIVAALWVWPMKVLRDALPSWIEGCVTLCFWSLMWNTTILLMACFRGYDETGTVMMTALNTLATVSVKCAFDFSGAVAAAGAQANAVGAALSGSMKANSAQGGGSKAAAGKSGGGSQGAPASAPGAQSGGGPSGIDSGTVLSGGSGSAGAVGGGESGGGIALAGMDRSAGIGGASSDMATMQVAQLNSAVPLDFTDVSKPPSSVAGGTSFAEPLVSRMGSELGQLATTAPPLSNVDFGVALFAAAQGLNQPNVIPGMLGSSLQNSKEGLGSVTNLALQSSQAALTEQSERSGQGLSALPNGALSTLESIAGLPGMSQPLGATTSGLGSPLTALSDATGQGTPLSQLGAALEAAGGPPMIGAGLLNTATTAGSPLSVEQNIGSISAGGAINQLAGSLIQAPVSIAEQAINAAGQPPLSMIDQAASIAQDTASSINGPVVSALQSVGASVDQSAASIAQNAPPISQAIASAIQPFGASIDQSAVSVSQSAPSSFGQPVASAIQSLGGPIDTNSFAQSASSSISQPVASAIQSLGGPIDTNSFAQSASSSISQPVASAIQSLGGSADPVSFARDASSSISQSAASAIQSVGGSIDPGSVAQATSSSISQSASSAIQSVGGSIDQSASSSGSYALQSVNQAAASAIQSTVTSADQSSASSAQYASANQAPIPGMQSYGTSVDQSAGTSTSYAQASASAIQPYVTSADQSSASSAQYASVNQAPIPGMQSYGTSVDQSAGTSTSYAQASASAIQPYVTSIDQSTTSSAQYASVNQAPVPGMQPVAPSISQSAGSSAQSSISQPIASAIQLPEAPSPSYGSSTSVQQQPASFAQYAQPSASHFVPSEVQAVVTQAAQSTTQFAQYSASSISQTVGHVLQQSAPDAIQQSAAPHQQYSSPAYTAQSSPADYHSGPPMAIIPMNYSSNYSSAPAPAPATTYQEQTPHAGMARSSPNSIAQQPLVLEQHAATSRSSSDTHTQPSPATQEPSRAEAPAIAQQPQSRISSALRGAGCPLSGMDRGQTLSAPPKQTEVPSSFEDVPRTESVSRLDTMSIAAGTTRNRYRKTQGLTPEDMEAIQQGAGSWLNS